MTLSRSLIFLVLAACAGCARTNIVSIKQSGYVFQEDKILVIEQMAGDDIQQGFDSSFPALMSSCGVKTVTEVLPQNLDNTQEARDNVAQIIHAHIVQYGLNTLLQVSRDSTTIMRTMYGAVGPVSYNYHATLKDSQYNKLWTSVMTLKPADALAGGLVGTSMGSMGEILARDLVAKMKVDGVLLKCPEKLP